MLQNQTSSKKELKRLVIHDDDKNWVRWQLFEFLHKYDYETVKEIKVISPTLVKVWYY